MADSTDTLAGADTPRAATTADRTAVRTLLTAAGLPVDDIDAPDIRLWVTEDAGGALVGCVGLEIHGPSALLRSLAVAPERRGAGRATALVAFARDAAATAGVTDLWTLTRDAEDWFRARGWTAVDRADAPAGIRRTRQFAGLCPASATLLTKSTGAA